MSGATDFHEDELRPETTAGFKVGEKKTLEEYQQLVRICACASSRESLHSMSIQFVNLETPSKGLSPRETQPELSGQDDQVQRRPSEPRKAFSIDRSSNRRQPWIDARKLSDEQLQQHIDAENQRKARRSSVRAALENTVDLFSKPPSKSSSRATSRDEGEASSVFVRAMPGDEEFKPSRRTVLNDRRRSLVHGLQTLHKHDSVWGSYDRGVLSKYSGGRDRDSKIPRKQSYVRTSTPNALLPSTDDERKWARQVLRYYSSTLDASQCDVFTWHALERKDDPVHLVICHGEMVFMDQYGQELSGEPTIIHQLEAIHRRGMLQPDYEDYEVPLTRIPTRQVEEQTADHFRALLERNGSEDLSPPSTVQVGWWLHNSPVYRVRYREAELWMTIDGRNMPNRPAISEQIKQIKAMTDDTMQGDRSSGSHGSSEDVSPSHIEPNNNQETRASQQTTEEQNRTFTKNQKPWKTWISPLVSLDGYQNDESLRKWKESLGIGSGTTIGDASDPRKVIIVSLGLEGRPDIIIDLSSPGALESLKSKPFTIKEGATFRMKARFRVQHQILSGMKYVQVVKRMGISNKMQEMIGSYSPNTTDKPEYEKKCVYAIAETAPSGMMARGHYNAVSKFIDDDEQTHLKFEWSFDIKKDW
ncbi:unnamed protein product, partial [Aureobasidium mustum]